MKVRLYRGPLSGKVMHARDGETRIQVGNMKRQTQDLFDENTEFSPTISYGYETYSIRMMGINLNGQSYRAPAMHPDGSVYFEWDKPRGSRRRD